MKNRQGQEVEVTTIEKVEWRDNGCEITRAEPGWGTFFVTLGELKGFRPEVGDAIITYMTNASMIQGIIIEGTVIRYRTKEEVAEAHEQWRKNLRLERLERYIKEKDAMQERVAALPKPLRERMERFGEEGGIDFWIEDAGYEMYACAGAAALLRKVERLGFITDVDNIGDSESEEPDDTKAAINWIEGWWGMNSAEHDPAYDYQGQKELVPDFGDGHSGLTASAAKSMAVAILEGQEV